MSIAIKTAILATAVCCAAPSHAATTTLYTFTANGVGYDYYRPAQDAPIDQYRFTYFYSATFTVAVGYNRFNVPSDYASPFQAGEMSIASSADRLFINLERGVSSRFLQGTSSIQACGNFGGMLPQTDGLFAIDPDCGFARLAYTNTQQYGRQFTGKISSLAVSTVTDFFGPGLSFAIAVPEASTWAMMLTGFAVMAYAMRRRVSVTFA